MVLSEEFMVEKRDGEIDDWDKVYEIVIYSVEIKRSLVGLWIEKFF